MKVAVNAMPLVNPLSGVGQYVFQLYSAMSALNMECDYYYGFYWAKKLEAGSHPKTAFVDNLGKKNWYGQKLIGLCRRLVFFRKMVTTRFDLYHEPNFLPKPHLSNLIITVHDLSPYRLPESHPKEWVRTFQEKLPHAIDNARAILVVSDFVKREIIDLFPDAGNKITRTYLGVRNEFRPLLHTNDPRFFREKNIEYGQYLLAIGTLEPRKNLISALKAYSLLPDKLRDRFPLVIGGMKGWLTEALDRELEPMQRKGQVRLLGFVPDDELNALYSGARAFIYPSLYEGFGLPPLEAMACGAPVITSNKASLPEVVGNAGILVEPLDIEQMNQAIESLLENDSHHHELRQKGLERASLFTWEKTASKTYEVFRRVAGENVN